MGTPGCQVFKVGKGREGVSLMLFAEMRLKCNPFCLPVTRP